MECNGHKKETLRENAVHWMQKHQLPQPQIQNNGRQAGIGEILQNRAQAHQAQGSEEINPKSKCQMTNGNKKSAHADFLKMLVQIGFFC